MEIQNSNDAPMDNQLPEGAADMNMPNLDSNHDEDAVMGSAAEGDQAGW